MAIGIQIILYVGYCFLKLPIFQWLKCTTFKWQIIKFMFKQLQIPI